MADTVPIRVVRGRIVPCQGCGRVYRCEMYKSFTRKRLRHGEYMQGTNILHDCAIYIPDKMPGSIKAPHRHNRALGITPT
jgi:hypothetical protein